MLCIDLYCGLGGWAEGFLSEGWDVVGFDIERHDYGTGGYPGKLVLQDVTTLRGSQFRNADVIVASPPCQAYSYRAMPWKRAKALPLNRAVMKEGVVHRSNGETSFHGHRQNPDGRKLPRGHDTFKKNGKPCNKLTDLRYGSDGTKQGGEWWHDPESMTRRHSSKSSGRKAASAQIAVIPFPLAQHIARVFKPEVLKCT
jgi:C-5 cytosine-specific DNA methylase